MSYDYHIQRINNAEDQEALLKIIAQILASLAHDVENLRDDVQYIKVNTRSLD